MSKIQHGGDIFEASRQLGVSPRSLLDFSVNLNPAGPPKDLYTFLGSVLRLTVYYPEPYSETLTERIAHKYNLPNESVLCGAGTTPIIYQIPRLLKPKKTAIIGPAFAEYEEGLTAAGLKFTYFNAIPEEDFLVTPELIERALKSKPDLIFIANPANPTGRLVPQESLELLLAAAKGPKGIPVVIDEAFIDFTINGNTSVSQVGPDSKVIILKSLTKLFAIPGLRVGYALGNPAIIEGLKALTEPWQIGTVAQLTGHFLFQQENYIKQTPAKVAALRQKLLVGLGTYRTYPSDANFVLISFIDEKPELAELLIDHLFSKNILVRDAGNFPGLIPGKFIRVAVKAEAANKKLIAGIKSLPASS
ncbi:MAG: pyridoxal phosphate-dependent class II aminotransferase [Deltaproteobacteria bacterium]|jgi:threonine-phosphate decarboxylase|nr:pyridoxal phosphate-dependent class II aminotransferase [Deltaproteobacteria bacterium]